MNKTPTLIDHGLRTADRLEELAFEYGQGYDSYLSTDRNLCQFWASNRQSVIAYARTGRFVHVQGGLLGPVEQRGTLLQEFTAFVQRQKWTATFYNISEEDLPHFEDLGFQVTKWGEEPLLDLADLTWSGRDYEWVRRQVNYCRRHELAVLEIDPDDELEADWDQVMEEIRCINAECLSTKPQRTEIRFFNGDVDPAHWDRRRLFVARADQGHGRIEGFLICLPYDEGRKWSVETYRYRLDAPRGIVAFMIHEAVDVMKSEGIESVSLCLCPAVRYEKLQNDSWVIRRCLQLGFNYASAFFDMPGEYHFKSRFRPRFVRRFICHFPHASMTSMWSIVRLSGAVDLDLKKFARILWRRLMRPGQRKNMVLPSAPAAKEPGLPKRLREPVTSESAR